MRWLVPSAVPRGDYWAVFTAAVKTARMSATPPPQTLALFQSKGNKIAIGCSIRSSEKPMTSIAIGKSLRSRGWGNIPLMRRLLPVGMKVETFFFVWQVRLGTLHRARRSEPKWLPCFIINLHQVVAEVPARVPSYLSTPPARMESSSRNHRGRLFSW